MNYMILAVCSNARALILLPSVHGKVKMRPTRTNRGKKNTRLVLCFQNGSWKVLVPEGCTVTDLRFLELVMQKYAVQIMHIKYLAEPGIR